MNRDDIVLMARKAGGIECDCCLPYLQDYSEKELAGFLERFAELIATAEREACCAIVYGQCESDNVAQRTVDAIRARGDK